MNTAESLLCSPKELRILVFKSLRGNRRRPLATAAQAPPGLAQGPPASPAPTLLHYLPLARS